MLSRGSSSGKLPPYAGAALYVSAGVQLATSTVAGLFIGDWADKHWGTSPLFTAIGLIAGFAGGIVNLIRIVRWMETKRP